MIDIGAWASDAYRVPVPEAPDPDDPDYVLDDSPRKRIRSS